MEDKPRVEVGLKELVISIIFYDILPLVSGAVIAALGYNITKSELVPGILCLIIGLTLVIRNGIIISFLKIGKCAIRSRLCCFQLDPDRYWQHPMGFDVPVTQCILPTSETADTTPTVAIQ